MINGGGKPQGGMNCILTWERGSVLADVKCFHMERLLCAFTSLLQVCEYRYMCFNSFLLGVNFSVCKLPKIEGCNPVGSLHFHI